MGQHVAELAAYLRGEATYMIMSGHDTVVAPLLAMLAAPDAPRLYQPDVASFANVELYDDGSVRVLARTRLDEEPAYVALRACGQTECNLDAFLAAMEPYAATQEEIDRICGASG